jgi:hypothetical protein
MQIHYSLLHLHQYSCNFFSDILLQFGDSLRVIAVYLAVEVSQEKIATSNKSADLAGH